MERVLRIEKKLKPPVGQEEASSQELAILVSARPPTGGFYSRLKKYAYKMRDNPTPTEKTLFSILENNNIPYNSQKVILPYIVDCFIPHKKLVIELDGKPHNTNINQLTYDTNRDELLMSLGILVVRFDNNRLNLTSILNLYKERNSCNPEKILSLIGKHNKRYEEKGFNNFSIKEFRQRFKRYLYKELNNSFI